MFSYIGSKNLLLFQFQVVMGQRLTLKSELYNLFCLSLCASSRSHLSILRRSILFLSTLRLLQEFALQQKTEQGIRDVRLMFNAVEQLVEAQDKGSLLDIEISNIYNILHLRALNLGQATFFTSSRRP